MDKKFKVHFGYYITLFVMLFLSGLLTLQFSFNKQLQMVIVVMTAMLYVLIGIVHHKENHDLNTKIVIEYVLIASLGMVIVFFLLGGGL